MRKSGENKSLVTHVTLQRNTGQQSGEDGHSHCGSHTSTWRVAYFDKVADYIEFAQAKKNRTNTKGSRFYKTRANTYHFLLPPFAKCCYKRSCLSQCLIGPKKWKKK